MFSTILTLKSTDKQDNCATLGRYEGQVEYQVKTEYELAISGLVIVCDNIYCSMFCLIFLLKK